MFSRTNLSKIAFGWQSVLIVRIKGVLHFHSANLIPSPTRTTQLLEWHQFLVALVRFVTNSATGNTTNNTT
jgi:hypothetical protein